MSNVFLINPVEAGDSQEVRFLERWIKQANLARKQPGLLSMNLHKSVDDGTRFRFVIVEQWDSIQAWEASNRLEQQTNPRHDYPCPHYPGVYRLFSH